MTRTRLPARWWLFMALPFLALLLAGPALAQGVITDDEVNDVAEELYCPVCENTPLDVCPTQACADWRELIRTQLSDGASQQDVLDYFSRQYGDGVLANPPRRGVSLIVLWILPVLGIALGLLLFARFVRNLRGGSAPVVEMAGGAGPTPVAPASPPPAPRDELPPSAPTPADLDDYVARVERELDK